MTISLQDFATLDTNYITKLNANNDAIESAVASLQTGLAGVSGIGALSIGNAYAALFGTAIALIGEGSYLPAGASSTLTVAAGYAWVPTNQQVLTKSTSTAISYSGLAAATYYVVLDATGTPTHSTSSTNAIYSVVWTGSAFGAITRLVTIAWGFSDWSAAKTSTALAATYTSLDARLEASETLVAGIGVKAFDVSVFFPGVPTASAIVLRIPIARAVSFAANFAGSYFTALVGATATTVFDVAKNGTTIGSISIAAGGTVATFTTTSGTLKTFAAGDVLKITCPATPDVSLADIGITLAGLRT